MRILLSNYDMNYLGGTQMWTYELWRQFSLEHTVHVFQSEGNSLWPEMEPFDPSQSYDVALINHWPTFRSLRRAKIGVRVFTSHGVISSIEIPPMGADAYVSVSEAVAHFIPFKSHVIRNPIDTDHFRSLTQPNKSLKRVAFVSNRQGRARAVVEEACSQMGVQLRVVGAETSTRDVVEVYNWADLVIGVARCALEAMACERNVICFDWVGGAGLATEQTVVRLGRTNFGGHMTSRDATWYSAGELVNLMQQYDPTRSLRPYVEANHRPDLVATQYLELAEASRTGQSSLTRSLRTAVLRGPRQLSSVEVTRRIIQGRDWVRNSRDRPIDVNDR